MTQQTEQSSEPVGTPRPARQKPRHNTQAQEVHHHHHYHARASKPRDVDMRGEPFDVVKARADKRAIRNALAVAALSPLLAGIAWWLGTGPFIMLIVGAAALLTGLSMYISKQLTPDDYYQIQGSRYTDGKHRCIACGHSGIWRHSPYRSNHTVAQCSNGACGVKLWREPKG